LWLARPLPAKSESCEIILLGTALVKRGIPFITFEDEMYAILLCI
jgi:hypothetical protein